MGSPLWYWLFRECLLIRGDSLKVKNVLLWLPGSIAVLWKIWWKYFVKDIYVQAIYVDIPCVDLFSSTFNNMMFILISYNHITRPSASNYFPHRMLYLIYSMFYLVKFVGNHFPFSRKIFEFWLTHGLCIFCLPCWSGSYLSTD